MTTVLLVIITVYAVLKAVSYKISVSAILLYYSECGVDLPSDEAIQKYTMKAVKKMFHIPS